ncbi:hypothetical protein G5B46_12705 [Caulobacter sp. 602-2]|uniref:Uncharacterized protein n=1 Tax=Caulobacter sp. 602-2 TaxID=2710887 RepID=A0A6G4QY56_9CAUL|nr:hypothetical protein [Caulobacter sp. 602-2]NGM50472.1 hypothetical protein [Caulobacter sp. 602-2]
MSALIFEIVWCAAFGVVGLLLLTRPRELYTWVRHLLYSDAALSDRGAKLIGPFRGLGFFFAVVGLPMAVVKLLALLA